jgi:PAS domain S-box-containing protein
MTPSPALFIVEDELIVAEDLRLTLEGLGYVVAGHEKTGERALETISSSRPDLVLMDIHLAGPMDGIDTAIQVRSRWGIPVIIISAHADKELFERAKVAEPYGYLVKPYDERGLQSAIEMALYKHRMEQALADSEKKTRILINASRDALYLLDARGKILFANETLAEMTGMTVAQLTGASAYALVGRKILTPLMACWQLDPRGRAVLQAEEQLHRNWYDVRISPVYDVSGAVTMHAAGIRDITEMKRAGDQQQHNAEYFRSLIEETAEIVVFLNADGTFSRQSASFRKALGYPLNVVLDKTIFTYIVISDVQLAKQVFSEVLTHAGQVKPLRVKCEKSDGTVCIIRGILSNLSENPYVKNIVFHGWIE